MLCTDSKPSFPVPLAGEAEESGTKLSLRKRGGRGKGDVSIHLSLFFIA